jgi:hypothetical protein
LRVPVARVFARRFERKRFFKVFDRGYAPIVRANNISHQGMTFMPRKSAQQQSGGWAKRARRPYDPKGWTPSEI